MAEFKTKKIVPNGIENMDDESRKFLDAIQIWGDQTFGEVKASIMSELAAQGFSADKLSEIGKAIDAHGVAIDKMRHSSLAPVQVTDNFKTAFFKNYEQLRDAVKFKQNIEIKAVAEHTEGNVLTTDNMLENNAEYIDGASVDPRLYLKRKDRQYIHDIADVIYVDTVEEVKIWDEEGTETGEFAIVEENTLKPMGKLQLVRNMAERQKAAGYIVATDEAMASRGRAWRNIMTLFRDKVYRDYENQLTESLLAKAGSYTSTALDGTIANPTDFDAIIAMMLQLENLNYQPNTLIISPTDKWNLAKTETKNGMLILPYIQKGGEFGLLSMRVITTNKFAPGEFLIGESNTWKIEEGEPIIRTGFVNDDLIKNRWTIVGEIPFLSYVPSVYSGAWIKGDFATIKEALKSA